MKYIRKGKTIFAGSEVKETFASINQAKQASRKLQQEGHTVIVVPHKTDRHYPLAGTMRKTWDFICGREDFKEALRKQNIPFTNQRPHRCKIIEVANKVLFNR